MAKGHSLRLSSSLDNGLFGERNAAMECDSWFEIVEESEAKLVADCLDLEVPPADKLTLFPSPGDNTTLQIKQEVLDDDVEFSELPENSEANGSGEQLGQKCLGVELPVKEESVPFEPSLKRDPLDDEIDALLNWRPTRKILLSESDKKREQSRTVLGFKKSELDYIINLCKGCRKCNLSGLQLSSSTKKLKNVNAKFGALLARNSDSLSDAQRKQIRRNRNPQEHKDIMGNTNYSRPRTRSQLTNLKGKVDFLEQSSLDSSSIKVLRSRSFFLPKVSANEEQKQKLKPRVTQVPKLQTLAQTAQQAKTSAARKRARTHIWNRRRKRLKQRKAVPSLKSETEDLSKGDLSRKLRTKVSRWDDFIRRQREALEQFVGDGKEGESAEKTNKAPKKADQTPAVKREKKQATNLFERLSLRKERTGGVSTRNSAKVTSSQIQEVQAVFKAPTTSATATKVLKSPVEDSKYSDSVLSTEQTYRTRSKKLLYINPQVTRTETVKTVEVGKAGKPLVVFAKSELGKTLNVVGSTKLTAVAPGSKILVSNSSNSPTKSVAPTSLVNAKMPLYVPVNYQGRTLLCPVIPASKDILKYATLKSQTKGVESNMSTSATTTSTQATVASSMTVSSGPASASNTASQSQSQASIQIVKPGGTVAVTGQRNTFSVSLPSQPLLYASKLKSILPMPLDPQSPPKFPQFVVLKQANVVDKTSTANKLKGTDGTTTSTSQVQSPVLLSPIVVPVSDSKGSTGGTEGIVKVAQTAGKMSTVGTSVLYTSSQHTNGKTTSLLNTTAKTTSPLNATTAKTTSLLNTAIAKTSSPLDTGTAKTTSSLNTATVKTVSPLNAAPQHRKTTPQTSPAKQSTAPSTGPVPKTPPSPLGSNGVPRGTILRPLIVNSSTAAQLISGTNIRLGVPITLAAAVPTDRNAITKKVTRVKLQVVQSHSGTVPLSPVISRVNGSNADSNDKYDEEETPQPVIYNTINICAQDITKNSSSSTIDLAANAMAIRQLRRKKRQLCRMKAMLKRRMRNRRSISYRDFTSSSSSSSFSDGSQGSDFESYMAAEYIDVASPPASPRKHPYNTRLRTKHNKLRIVRTDENLWKVAESTFSEPNDTDESDSNIEDQERTGDSSTVDDTDSETEKYSTVSTSSQIVSLTTGLVTPSVSQQPSTVSSTASSCATVVCTTSPNIIPVIRATGSNAEMLNSKIPSLIYKSGVPIKWSLPTQSTTSAATPLSTTSPSINQVLPQQFKTASSSFNALLLKQPDGSLKLQLLQPGTSGAPVGGMKSASLVTPAISSTTLSTSPNHLKVLAKSAAPTSTTSSSEINKDNEMPSNPEGKPVNVMMVGQPNGKGGTMNLVPLQPQNEAHDEKSASLGVPNALSSATQINKISVATDQLRKILKESNTTGGQVSNEHALGASRKRFGDKSDHLYAKLKPGHSKKSTIKYEAEVQLPKKESPRRFDSCSIGSLPDESVEEIYFEDINEMHSNELGQEEKLFTMVSKDTVPKVVPSRGDYERTAQCLGLEKTIDYINEIQPNDLAT